MCGLAIRALHKVGSKNSQAGAVARVIKSRTRWAFVGLAVLVSRGGDPDVHCMWTQSCTHATILLHVHRHPGCEVCRIRTMETVGIRSTNPSLHMWFLMALSTTFLWVCVCVRKHRQGCNLSLSYDSAGQGESVLPLQTRRALGIRASLRLAKTT